MVIAPGNRLHRLEGDLAHHWAVSVSGNLATDILIRWGRRDPRRLLGLPLEVKNNDFQSCTSRRSFEGLPGRHHRCRGLKAFRCDRAHLSRILNGRAGISASMSLRLSAALRTSPDFWLKMQLQHDLWQERQKKQPKIQSFRRAARLA